jgi:hypothetical protein
MHTIHSSSGHAAEADIVRVWKEPVVIFQCWKHWRNLRTLLSEGRPSIGQGDLRVSAWGLSSDCTPKACWSRICLSIAHGGANPVMGESRVTMVTASVASWPTWRWKRPPQIRVGDWRKRQNAMSHWHRLLSVWVVETFTWRCIQYATPKPASAHGDMCQNPYRLD